MLDRKRTTLFGGEMKRERKRFVTAMVMEKEKEKFSLIIFSVAVCHNITCLQDSSILHISF